MRSFHQIKRSDNKQYAVEVRWGFFLRIWRIILFLRAVVNIPIQTLIIPPWLLLRKMIISQLEFGPPVEIWIFFLEQIFTSGIILNETAKTKVWKFIYCMLKDTMSTKTMNCVRVDDFLLFLGAGYLPEQVICWNFFLFIAIDRCG